MLAQKIWQIGCEPPSKFCAIAIYSMSITYVHIHVYVYVCMYVWVYVCMYIHTYIHTYTPHIHTCMHAKHNGIFGKCSYNDTTKELMTLLNGKDSVA